MYARERRAPFISNAAEILENFHRAENERTSIWRAFGSIKDGVVPVALQRNWTGLTKRIRNARPYENWFFEFEGLFFFAGENVTAREIGR